MHKIIISAFAIACSVHMANNYQKVMAEEPQISLQEHVAGLRDDVSIPALALAEFSCETRNLAFSGVVRNDRSPHIASGARFNIGSNAKSMLATVAAKLDEKGILDLDAELGTLWPKAVSAHPDKVHITLTQLLSHTSGLPAFDTGAALDTVPDFNADPASITRKTALWFLQQPLMHTPGQESVYSNAGYIVAGAVLEHVTGMEFKELVRQELFVPLRLDAAFGEPKHHGDNEPFGHYVSDGEIIPYDEPTPPIPPFLTTAGNISLSMDDYVTYLQIHLCGLRGEDSALMSADMVERLHTPHVEGGAGLGWGITELGGSTTSFHIGGTGDFTAYMALSPERNKGAAAMLSIGGNPAAAAQAWIVNTMSKP